MGTTCKGICLPNPSRSRSTYISKDIKAKVEHGADSNSEAGDVVVKHRVKIPNRSQTILAADKTIVLKDDGV